MSTCFWKCQFSSVIVQGDNVVDDGARHTVMSVTQFRSAVESSVEMHQVDALLTHDN